MHPLFKLVIAVVSISLQVCIVHGQAPEAPALPTEPAPPVPEVQNEPALAPMSAQPSPPAAVPAPAAKEDSASPVPSESAAPAAGAPSDAKAEAVVVPAWPIVRIGGRIMAGYELERVHPKGTQSPVADGTEPGFFLDQARLMLEGEMHESLRAELSADFESGVAIRNAYVNWRPEKEAQLRVGRFKRPLSRLSNESIGALPFRKRGLYDNLIMEDAQWGDRALGAMLHGKPSKRVRYHFAVMSPAAMGTGIEGADVIARFEYAPVAALSLGVAAAHKWTERFEDGPNLSLNAASVDVAFEASGFYAALEGNASQNPNPPPIAGSTAPRTALALGFIGYVGYYAQLAPALRLGPVGVFEWMDTDSSYGEDERVRGVLGASLTFQEHHLRFMPQIEVVRPLGKVTLRSEVAEENYYLLTSAEF